MIEKINLKCAEATSFNSKQEALLKKGNSALIRNDSEVLSKNAADALKTINFCGKLNYEAKETSKGINLNELVNSEDDNVVFEGSEKKYIFSKTEKGFEIKDGKNVILRAEYTKSEKLPNITYKAGKFAPEVTIHDDSLDGGRIQMFSGSQIKGLGFKLTMPGKCTDYNSVCNNGTISFTGRTLVTTLNLEQKTKEAVDKYFASGLASQTTKGDYSDFMKEQDPTIAIPAGGFGTRFANMTDEEGENKPSFRLPTDDNYRIMATALNMGAMAGLIGGDDDKLDYASQARGEGSLDEAGNVHKVGEFKTDGGAIYEALNNNIIPRDKDLVILNADIITNADITRAYHALKTLPDAALVIPYYPVDAQRARSFGLMGLQKDENNNLQIKDFIEKPPHTHIDDEPTPDNFRTAGKYDTYEKVHAAWKAVNDCAKLDDGSEKYYGNPGIYVMSKEAAEVLRQLGEENPNKTGLGASVMPKIVELCNSGKLKTADGRPMKVYTVPLQRKGGSGAFWDDIGSASAYLKTIKDIGVETSDVGTGESNKYYGIPEFVLKDFSKNFDTNSNVLYMSRKAMDDAKAFCDKYYAEMNGNIFVAD